MQESNGTKLNLLERLDRNIVDCGWIDDAKHAHRMIYEWVLIFS